MSNVSPSFALAYVEAEVRSRKSVAAEDSSSMT